MQAQAACTQCYGFDCFSEDTGLEVAALGGAPGVHTARYAGEGRDPQENIALLLRNLAGKADRSARFRTIIALILNGKETLLEGICAEAASLLKDQQFAADLGSILKKMKPIIYSKPMFV